MISEFQRKFKITDMTLDSKDKINFLKSVLQLITQIPFLFWLRMFILSPIVACVVKITTKYDLGI